jgi:hypothetical protein
MAGLETINLIFKGYSKYIHVCPLIHRSET